MRRAVRGLLPGAAVSQAEAWIPVPALFIEALWVYPLMLWIATWDATGWAHPPLGLGSTLLVLAAAFLSARWAGREEGGRGARLLTLVGSLLLIALLLRLEQGGGFAIWDPAWGEYGRAHLQKLVSGTVFGMYLLWRGLSLGRDEITFDRLYKSFFFGMGALALLLVFWSIEARRGGAELNAAAGGYVAGFFLAGLAALALSNFRSIQEEAQRLGSGSEGISRRWIGLAIVIAAFMVLVALGISSIVSLNFVTYFRNPLSTLADWVFTVVWYVIILPLAFVIEGVFYALQWVVNLFRDESMTPDFDRPSREAIRRTAEDNQGGLHVPDALITAGKWGSLAIVIAIALFILYRLYMRRRPEKQESTTKELSESLFSWAQFLEDIRSFLRALMEMFRRKVARVRTANEEPPPLASLVSEDDGRTLNVREIYQGLLWEGRRAGRPKREQETPFEYSVRLEASLPRVGPEVEIITRDYVEARYGHRDLEPQQVTSLNRLWRRLKARLTGEDR